jgi:hypothetical protein
VPLSRNLIPLTYWNTLVHSRPVTGLFYLLDGIEWEEVKEECDDSTRLERIRKQSKEDGNSSILDFQEQISRRNISLSTGIETLK